MLRFCIEIFRLRFFEEEENYSIVYGIREIILNHVLDACYQKYLEKQSVKFLVHCAYKALVKLIDLNFYVHNPVWSNFQNSPDWSADAPPEPSPPDTWAAYNVPFSTPQSEVSEILSSTITSTASDLCLRNKTESTLDSYLHDKYDFDQELEEENLEKMDYEIIVINTHVTLSLDLIYIDRFLHFFARK